jgi:hypothetical protein
MIIALSIAYDDGDFAVHYAKTNSLEQAQAWCEKRKANLEKQGTPCASAVLNTDHVQLAEDCSTDDSRTD